MAGQICARHHRGRGSKSGKVVLKEHRETTGEAKTICLTADRTTISANGKDFAILKAEVLDALVRQLNRPDDS